MMSLEILMETCGDRADAVELINKAIETTEKGATLTHRLLAFSRKQVLAPKFISVNGLIGGMLDMLRRTLGETVEIQTPLDEDASKTLIDPAQLESAVLNLAINARDAMPDGERLTIETENVDIDDEYDGSRSEVRPGPYVLLAVSDNGVGMSPGVRDRVFDPFFTTKEVGRGTGLGASMVFGFVKQSQGHVTIYSEKGEGTTVRLYLPRVPEDAAEDSLPPVASKEAPGKNELVLLVEDDYQVRALTKALLTNLGYLVNQAGTGADALAALDDGEAADLLLTDVILPGGMSGGQLADEIGRRSPRTRILFMSGYTEDALAHHGRLPSGVNVLQKPFRKAALARAVRSALDGG